MQFPLAGRTSLLHLSHVHRGGGFSSDYPSVMFSVIHKLKAKA